MLRHRGRTARDALSRHAGSALDLRYGPAIPLAIVFDVFDGRIALAPPRLAARPRARLTGRLISFGVAPAAIAYAVGLNTAADQVVLVLRSLRPEPLGANVTAESMADDAGKVPYFEGRRFRAAWCRSRCCCSPTTASS
jgi:CDP-diacylglycerol--serine O-phosphatidyltransferase